MNQIQNNQSTVEINITDLLKQNADYKLEIEKLKRELDYFKRIILEKNLSDKSVKKRHYHPIHYLHKWIKKLHYPLQKKN